MSGKKKGEKSEGYRPCRHGVIREDIDPFTCGSSMDRALEFQISDCVKDCRAESAKGEKHIVGSLARSLVQERVRDCWKYEWYALG